ncbi:MAG: tetratricopeptide repeat protein [Chitinispirillaceae bacterium]|nr:tetratricopeptide repeat protein [Chitinispirillaceae bacterium]
MRSHRVSDFILMITALLFVCSFTVAADDAFDKLYSSGKYKEAIDYADEKIPAGDRNSALWAKLGVANEEQQMIEKALACYMVSIRLDQKNYEAYLGASRVYNKMGQAESALEMSKKAMDLKLTGEAAWTFSQACISLNRVAEAKTALEKVTEVDPTNMIAQRALGNIYYKEKNYNKAVGFLKKAYESKPDGETALDLANAYKIIGDLDEAEKYYKEASRDRKKAPPEAAIELARIYFKKEKYSDATETFDNTDKSKLTGQDLFSFATSIEKSNGDKGKMARVLEAAIKKSGSKATPEILAAKESIGKYFIEKKDYKEALSAFEYVRSNKGDSKVKPEILFMIADAYEGLKQRSRAIPILEAIIARDAKNVEAYARLADLYSREKQPAKAKGIYEKLLKLQPNSPEVYLTLGEYNLKAKKFEDAMKNFQKSFTLDQQAVAAIGMMNSAWALKRYDIARDAAESALHKDGKLREPQIILAKIHIREKNYAAATDRLEDLLKGDSKNLELLELLADCYSNLGKTDKLSDIDKKIIEIDKNNVNARLRFARYSQDSGDLKEAKSILDELIKMQPKNTEVLKSLYEISLKNDDKKGALSYLNKYLAIKSNDAPLQKACGDLQYETGNKTAALSAYRTAMKINPSIKGFYKRYAEIMLEQKSDKKNEQEVINVLNAAVKAGEADAEIYSTLGSIYKNQKKYPLAISMLQKALQKDPKDIESLSMLAYCQEKAGKLSEAIISYEQAAAMDSKNADEYKALGLLYQKTGKKSQAMGAYKKYLEKASDASIAIMVGEYEYNQKKYEDASKYFSKVTGAAAEKPSFLTIYADAAYKSGDTQNAELLLKKLSVKSPTNANSFQTLYEISLKAGKKSEAAEYLNKYTTLNPKDAASLQKLADLYFELKNQKEAIDAYRKVLKANPKAKGIYKNYLSLVASMGTAAEKSAALNGAVAAGEADADAYKQLGDINLTAKDYTKALQYYEKSSQLDPKDITVLKAVAECQALTGNISAAILTYEQVVALDPKADDELKALGDLYRKQKKDKNAVATYKKYLEKRSDDSIAIFVGNAALDSKNPSEAITYYEKVKGKAAQSAGFLTSYGQACFLAKNDEKALEVYRKLATTTPQNAEVFNTLFKLLFKKNQKDEALPYLKKYLALKPDNAQMQKMLGDMLFARQDKAGTIAAYEAALKADPQIKGFYKKYAELTIEKGNDNEIAVVLARAVDAGEADTDMYKKLGAIYVKQKKYAQAIPLFEKASQRDPKNVDLLADLADAQARSGNVSAAVLTYEQVIALNPKATDEYKALGDLYKKQNKTDLAIMNFKKYLEKKTDNSVALEVAEYSFGKKEYSEAVKYYALISGPEAGKPEVLQNYAEASLLANNNTKALELYKQLAALQPQNPAVLKKLYQIAEKAGSKDDVLYYLKKYAALNSKDAEAQKQLGDLLYERKDSNGALISYRAAFQSDPKLKGYFKRFAELIMKSGKQNELIQVLSAAIAAGEADVEMHIRLGQLYLAQKNYPRAIALYEKASQLDPKNTSVLSDLAKAQVASGNTSAATLTYEQVVVMNPNAEEEYKELGGLYMKQKKTDQAIKIYIKYLEKKQDNEIADLVGKAMYDRKEYKEALKYLGMVVGSGANNTDHLKLYGQAATKAKDEFKAYQIFRQLSTVSPKDPEVFEKLYDLSQRVGTKDDVLNYLKTYTSLKPGDAAAQKKLGDILYSKKDEQGALTAYRQALKADSSMKGFYKNYASLVMSKGSDSEKELALNGAVAAGEADARMYETLGNIYLKRKLYDKAIKMFDKASQLDPKNDKLLSSLAECYVKKGSISEAISTYEQVVALNPRAEEELKTLGELYFKIKKNTLALKYYKKYLDKKPSDAQVAYIVGETAYKTRDFNDAVKFLSMVRGGAENKPSFIKMYGDAAYAVKDYPRALVQYSKLVKLTPKDASVYKKLFEINMKTGAKNDALQNLQTYSRFMPRDADAQKELGDMLYEKGEKVGALSAYRKALTADPKIKGLYKNYVPLVLASGKYQEKMAALKGAIAAKEADALVYKTLGAIYTSAKKYNDAIKMFQEAIDLDKKDAALYLDYSDCLIKAGKFSDAAGNLEQALSLNPSAVKEYKLLGDLHMKQTKTDDAIEAYTKYLNKSPGDEAIAKVVALYYYDKKKYGDAYKYFSLIKKSVNTDILVPYGISALQSKQYATAIKVLEQVRSSTGTISNRGDAYKALSDAYEKSGNHKKAAEVLTDYVRLPGVKDPDAAYQIAGVYESIDMKQAIKMYSANTKSYPKDFRNFLKLGRYYAKQKGREKTAIAGLERTVALVDTIPDVYLELGALYGSLNETDNMLRVYRKFIEVDPKNAAAMAKIGEELLGKNMVSDALIFLEMANAEVDDNPKYLTLLARGYLETGRQREGAQLIEKVIRATKGEIDDDLRLTLADVYIATEEYSKAANELKDILKNSSNPSAEVLLKYAQTLIAAGKTNDALKIAEQVKSKQPENIEVHMIIGKIRVAQKKYNDAIETYKEILYMDQNYAPALYERANVYLLQGKLQWAKTFFDRAMKVDPKNGLIYLGLARLAKEQKDYASYSDLLEKARKLSPQNKEIQAEMRSAH